MDDRLNVKTQIWADGYSFMEVTETLLMALGIRTEDGQESEPGRPEPAASKVKASCHDAGADR
ncbi:MAG TPA: hypothetical protein DHV63_06600 [Pseudomonas sp.]|nr:hypothetical protein [Pseudomonas sp.]